MRARRATALLIVCASCASDELSFVSSSSFASEYGFFLFEGEGGLIVGQTELVRVADAPTTVDLPDGDVSRVLFLGFDDERLLEASPHFDPARTENLDIGVGTNDCPLGDLSADGTKLALSMPSSVEVLSLDRGSDWKPVPADSATRANVGELALDLPADTRSCLEDSPDRFEPLGGVAPIARTGDPLAERTMSASDLAARNIYRLPDGRVLVGSRKSVWLVERGQAFQNRPGDAVSLYTEQDAWQLAGMAVDPDPSRGNGGLRVFVSAHEEGLTTEDTLGALFELRLGPNGLERVGTATPTDSPLESVEIDPRTGRLLVGSRPGIIFTMMPGGPLETITLPASDDKQVEIFVTGFDDPRYIVTGFVAGAILFGDLSDDGWEFQTGLPDGASFRAFDVRSNGEELEYWAGSTEGRFFRRVGNGRWTEVIPRYGPPFAACGAREADCGWYRNGGSTRGFVPLSGSRSDQVLMFVDACAGVLLTRQDGACTEIVSIDDRPFGSTEGDQDFKTFHETEEWVTLAGRDGSIYELRK